MIKTLFSLGRLGRKKNKLNNALFSSTVDYPMPPVVPPKDSLITMEYLTDISSKFEEEQKKLAKLEEEKFKNSEEVGQIWAQFIISTIRKYNIPKWAIESGIHTSYDNNLPIVKYDYKLTNGYFGTNSYTVGIKRDGVDDVQLVKKIVKDAQNLQDMLKERDNDQ